MLKAFAKMLGLSREKAEEALYSERAARVALSRRGFLAAGAAFTAGAGLKAFSFGAAPAGSALVVLVGGGVTCAMAPFVFYGGQSNMVAAVDPGGLPTIPLLYESTLGEWVPPASRFRVAAAGIGGSGRLPRRGLNR